MASVGAGLDVVIQAPLPTFSLAWSRQVAVIALAMSSVRAIGDALRLRAVKL